MNIDNDWNPGHSIGGGYPYEKNEATAAWPQRPIVRLDRNTGKVFFDPNGMQYESFLRAHEIAIRFYDWMVKNQSVPHTELSEEQLKEYYQVFRESVPEGDFEDRMMFIAAETMETLALAEEQVDEMLSESPFSPELHGFELVASNKDISERPQAIYVSKYSPEFAISRKPGSPNDPSWTPHMWVLSKKTEDSMINLDISFPCSRIAYATLAALGVKMRSPETKKED